MYIHLMKDQESYCKDCVMCGNGCNTILQEGEECLEKEVE